MPLVEIIRGKETSDEALAKAYDVVQQIRKSPIVVNDSRGFYTSRVIGTMVNEGLAMLAEGVHPVSLERAATQDRKSTRLNSSHANISYAVFCLKNKRTNSTE